MQATAEEGTVRIESRRDTLGGKPCCILSVLDDGIGIPEEYMTLVWQPFLSRKNDRNCLGLGLTLVRHLATATSTIPSIASAPGVGTRVDLALQAA